MRGSGLKPRPAPERGNQGAPQFLDEAANGSSASRSRATSARSRSISAAGSARTARTVTYPRPLQSTQGSSRHRYRPSKSFGQARCFRLPLQTGHGSQPAGVMGSGLRCWAGRSSLEISLSRLYPASGVTITRTPRCAQATKIQRQNAPRRPLSKSRVEPPQAGTRCARGTPPESPLAAKVVGTANRDPAAWQC
jgi:hypothetical protein